MNLEIPFQINCVKQDSNTSDYLSGYNRFYFDDGWFTGTSVAYYFEVVAENDDDADRYIQLIDSGSNVKATVTVPASTADPTRIARVAFTPVSGPDWYQINLEGTTVAGQLDMLSARIIIVIEEVTKCAVQIMMGQRDNFDTYLDYVSDTSGAYANSVNNAQPNFRYSHGMFDGSSVSWLMVYHYNPNLARDRGFQLYNFTDSTVIHTKAWTDAGTGSVWTTETLTAPASDDDGDMIGLRHMQDGSGTNYLYNWYVVAIIEIPTSVPVYFSLGENNQGSLFDTEVVISRRAKVNKTAYSGGSVVAYLESCVWDEGAGETRTITLENEGTAESGVSGTDITTELDPTSEVLKHAVYRSSNMYGELTDGNRYCCGGGSGTGQIQFTNLFLIIHVRAGGCEITSPNTAVINVTAYSASPAQVQSIKSPSVIIRLATSPHGSYVEQVLSWARESAFVVLIDIYLDTGTLHTSPWPVRSTDTYWDGKVTGIGDIERAVEIPAGLVRVADGSVTIADTDRTLRAILGTEQARGNLIDIHLLPEGEPLSKAKRIYYGEITTVDLPEGEVVLNFSDRTFVFLDDEIPPLITIDNFPDLPEGSEDKEIFAPIPFGTCASSAVGGQGAIDCPQVDSGNREFCVSRFEIEEVTTVWRKRSDEEVFTAVGSGYTIDTEEKTIDGIDYTFVLIVFGSDQGDGTLIRADVKGLLVLDNSSPFDGVPDESSRNLAWNLYGYLSQIARQPDAVMNLLSFDALAVEFDSRGWFCDGRIVQKMTHRAAISQMVGSFNADFFQDKDGLIKVGLSATTPDPDVIYTDNFHLLREGLVVHMAEPICTKLIYNWFVQPGGTYLHQEVYEDAALAAEIGKTVERVQDLPFVRDSDTAWAVAADMASYLGGDSHRMDFGVDTPETIDSVELANIIGINHYGGIGGAYVEVPFKMESVRFSLDELAYRVKAIRRITPPERTGSILTGTEIDRAAFTGPYLYGTRILGVFKQADTNNAIRVAYSDDWGASWSYADSVALTAEIASFNSIQDPSNPAILHIVAQEDQAAGGRVAYFRFSASRLSYLVENEEVVASTNLAELPNHVYGGSTSEGCEVVLADDGTVIVYYHDAVSYYDPADDTYELEAASPGNYWFQHIYVSKRLGTNTWQTPVRACWNATTRCVASGNSIGTIWPGTSGRVHLFFGSAPGDYIAATSDIYSSTFTSATGIVSTNGRMVRTSLVFYEAPFTFGRAATDADGNGVMMHKGYSGYAWTWLIDEAELVAGSYDVGNATNTFLMSYSSLALIPYESSAMAARAQCHTFFVAGEEHRIISTTTGSPDMPLWNGEQCGYDGGSQHFDALIFVSGGQLCIASFAANTDSAIDFQLYPEDDLPAAGYSRSDWLTEFGL